LSSLQKIEDIKRRVSEKALNHIKDGLVVGIGSGSTVAIFIEILSEYIKKTGIEIITVPTSYQVYFLLLNKGVKVSSLIEHPEIDITVDGADKIDDDLQLIKGGGGALTQEKIVAAATKKDYIIIADYRKYVPNLNNEEIVVPIEVIPMAVTFVRNEIIKLGGVPLIRNATKKVGPIVTDNGNLIIDAKFTKISLKKLNSMLKDIPGVVETGIFANFATCAYIGFPDKVITKKRKKQLTS